MEKAPRQRFELKSQSPKAWLEAVMSDFDTFLVDHAACERKASATCMSFVVKYRDKVELVKDFGTENEYTKLTHGEFESYKEEGWQFASITLKLLNGIGLYRPETDRHYIFLVLSELVDHGVAQEEKDKYVDCERHERRRRAFICQHLKNNSRNGFEEAFPTYESMEFEYDDDDFQAWCNDCEKIRLQQDGWDETSMAFAKIKVVCEKCYFEIKESNLYHCKKIRSHSCLKENWYTDTIPSQLRILKISPFI